MIPPPKKIGTLAALFLSVLPFFLPPAAQAAPRSTPTPQSVAKPMARRFLLAHYMPWFQARPFRPQWGWHWTMGRFDPDTLQDGRRGAASHYFPLMGLYDSGDPEVLQCQVLLMKLAGIDGVILDWYGHDDYYDYAVVNRNAERLIPILRRAGLRFAVCYETQTVAQEIKGGVFPESDAVGHGQRLMAWLQTHFFSQPNYLWLDGRPVLLTFGDPYYKNGQWEQLLSGRTPRPLLVTESDRRVAAAEGGFDWPAPDGGAARARAEQEAFYRRAPGWPVSVAAAFPRFDDIYAQAGVHASWGHIDDRDGRTYTDTLTGALQSGARVVQVVTWNDWGEGTQIEPSVEFGYRDLETTQRLRRRYLGPSFPATAQDLRLPVRWYLLSKKYAADPAIHAKLTAFFPLMIAGQRRQAQALLDRYDRRQAHGRAAHRAAPAQASAPVRSSCSLDKSAWPC